MFFRNLIQKVRLALILVLCAGKVGAAVLFQHVAVVSRRDKVGVKVFGVLCKRAEFDFPVAQDVGVRREPAFIVIDKLPENVIPVFLGQIDGVIRYVEFPRDGAHVVVVVKSGTATAFVFFNPVSHEQPDDVVALLFQEKRGNAAVDAAAHTKHNSFLTHRTTPSKDISYRRREG